MKSITLTEAQEKLDVWKNVSRLAVYLMNDYDFFSNVQFKDSFKCQLYSTAMINLGFKKQNNIWFSVCKPDLDIILNYIFKFCFYSYVVQSKRSYQITDDQRSDVNSSISINVEEESLVDKCIICDTKILPHEEKCNMCEEPVANMRKDISVWSTWKSNRKRGSDNQNTFNKNPKVTEKTNESFVVNKDEYYIPVCVKPKPGTSAMPCNRAETNLPRDNNEKDIASVDNNVKQLPISRSNYVNRNCNFSSNRFKLASWLCEQCTNINKVCDNKCAICKFENKSITNSTKNSTKKGKETPNSKYSVVEQKKPNIDNKTKNSFAHCGESSLFNDRRTDSDSKRKQIKITNQKKNDEPESRNNSKNIMETAQNEKHGISKCWNGNCKQLLDHSEEFCKNCKLSKHGKYERTTYRSRNKTKIIWICRECHRYNDFPLKKCVCNQGGPGTLGLRK